MLNNRARFGLLLTAAVITPECFPHLRWMTSCGALYRAIYGDPTLSKYGWSSMPSIHIIVKNGHVTLEGVVDSEADKNLAGSRANSVPNVFDVKDNLMVRNNH